MEWIIRVNTKTGKINKEKASEEEMHWGGRLLISKFLLREVPPICDPLGRHNKLIIAPGLLGDTTVTTTGKFSIGGKSPLTRGVKESDVGGEAGKKIARLGIKAVVLEDIPEKLTTKILTLARNKAELFEFPELKHKYVSETISLLRERFGNQVAIICIGPAGEMKMSGAGVAVSGPQDIQTRYAARGGLGAVMGSKGIKAIIVDDTDTPPPPVFDEALLRDAARNLVQGIMADPKTENRHQFGTPAVLMLCNEIGILPTRNFIKGSFDHAEEISGDKMKDTILVGTEGCYACSIRCKRVVKGSCPMKQIHPMGVRNMRH